MTVVFVLAAVAALTGYQATTTYRTLTRIERHHMSTQAAINAVVAQLHKAKDELATKLEAATLNILGQLTDAGVVEEIDLSALTAIAQQLDDLVPDTTNEVELVTEDGDVLATVEVATDEPELFDETTDEG